MKIAVVLYGMARAIGGGYTFEQEIVESLLHCAGDTPHDFLVFNAPLALRGDRGIRNIRFTPAPPAPLARIARVTEPIWLDAALRRAGIDLVWNVSPFHAVTDTPFITTLWDLQHRIQPFFPEVSAGRQWERREKHFSSSLGRAMAVVTGTEVGKEDVSSFYQVPASRIHVLPLPTPGFALKESAPGAVAETKRDYLLYPAQVWPHKNHAGLLHALAVLKREHGLTLPLVVVGTDKGNAGYLRKVASYLGVDDQVTYRGFVSQSELIDLYRNALAMTYVTLFGPDNLPPLEAFALGCPVIASNIPGAEEQLGDAALRVDCTDPQRLAEAIESLHRNPRLRQDLIERGLVRARSWTGDHYVHGIFKLIDGLVPLLRCWRSGAMR